MCYLRPHFFLKSETVFQRANKSHGIYFIFKGVLELTHSSNDVLGILRYKNGSYFGDNFLIDEANRCSANVISSNLECLYLSKEKLYSVIQYNPEILIQLKTLSLFKRTAQILEEKKFNQMTSKAIKHIITVKNRKKGFFRDNLQKALQNKKRNKEEFKEIVAQGVGEFMDSANRRKKERKKTQNFAKSLVNHIELIAHSNNLEDLEKNYFGEKITDVREMVILPKEFENLDIEEDSRELDKDLARFLIAEPEPEALELSELRFSKMGINESRYALSVSEGSGANLPLPTIQPVGLNLEFVGNSIFGEKENYKEDVYDQKIFEMMMYGKDSSKNIDSLEEKRDLSLEMDDHKDHFDFQKEIFTDFEIFKEDLLSFLVDKDFEIGGDKKIKEELVRTQLKKKRSLILVILFL